MLSNIKSYLFGNNTNAEDNVTDDSRIEFKEVEEEDWMLVDTSEIKRVENRENEDLIVSQQLFDCCDQSSSTSLYYDNDNEVKFRRQRSNSVKDLYHRLQPDEFTPLRELSPSVLNSSTSIKSYGVAKSRSSSRSSSQCFMEESWFVTPPPCFVAEPYDTKPSSLENLLIENPGIDFPAYKSNAIASLTSTAITSSALHYEKEEEERKKTDDRKQNRTKVAIKASKKKPSTSKLSNDGGSNVAVASSNFAKDAVTVDGRYHHGVAVRTEQQQQLMVDRKERRRLLMKEREDRKVMNALQSQLNCGQKAEQVFSTQHFKRNQLEKQNKVQFELTSRKKRQRRADFNKKHSGANNNRKCCY